MDHADQRPGVNAPITVMIVDDDLMVRTMLLRLLSPRRDLQVIGVFADGFAALKAAAEREPDIMVVDISMPAMSGQELTERAVKLFPGTKFLAFTSLADEQSISGMLHAGAAGVVYKEAPISALADAIRATYSGLSVLSPRFSRELARPRSDETFSETEMSILHLVSRGMTNEQIGSLVGLSPSTVKYHISRLSDRLGANNRVTLAVEAVHLGLTGKRPGGKNRPST